MINETLLSIIKRATASNRFPLSAVKYESETNSYIATDGVLLIQLYAGHDPRPADCYFNELGAGFPLPYARGCYGRFYPCCLIPLRLTKRYQGTQSETDPLLGSVRPARLSCSRCQNRKVRPCQYKNTAKRQRSGSRTRGIGLESPQMPLRATKHPEGLPTQRTTPKRLCTGFKNDF